MTAAPLNNGLAKVRKLLPVRISERRDHVRGDEYMIRILDKDGAAFCMVPRNRDDAMARAELIRDAMNEMA